MTSTDRPNPQPADEPVVWAGRTFGELSRDEQIRAGRAAGAVLADEFARNAEAISAILDAAEAPEPEVAPGESAAESCIHPAVACSPALVACPCDCRHCSTWRADWAEKMSATLAAPALHVGDAVRFRDRSQDARGTVTKLGVRNGSPVAEVTEAGSPRPFVRYVAALVLIHCPHAEPEAVEPEAERYAAEIRFRVHYWHGARDGGYMVYRPFRTREAAQEFIDANAMVHRLPRVELEQVACEIHGYNPCAACAFDRPGASA